MVLIDLDRVAELPIRRGRFGWVSWRPQDHGDGSATPLKAQVEAHLAAAGIEAGGAVRLLTMPRVLGYGFNPISLYFCHRPDGALAAVLYEVTNTFGERHSYLIATPEGPIRQTTEKQLFVSPFMDQALTYDFTVQAPGEAVSVVVKARRGDTPLLAASFAGARRELTPAALARVLLTHPLLTWKATFGIHWEALKLILKGARYRVRGAPPAHAVTMGRPR